MCALSGIHQNVEKLEHICDINSLEACSKDYKNIAEYVSFVSETVN